MFVEQEHIALVPRANLRPERMGSGAHQSGLNVGRESYTQQLDSDGAATQQLRPSILLGARLFGEKPRPLVMDKTRGPPESIPCVHWLREPLSD